MLCELLGDESRGRIAPVMLDVVQVLRRDCLAVILSDLRCEIFLADTKRLPRFGDDLT